MDGDIVFDLPDTFLPPAMYDSLQGHRISLHELWLRQEDNLNPHILMHNTLYNIKLKASIL